MGSTETVPFTYFAQAQTTFKPPLIANENAYLGDIATSQSNDPKAPITSGFYRLEKGMPSPIPKLHGSHFATDFPLLPLQVLLWFTSIITTR